MALIVTVLDVIESLGMALNLEDQLTPTITNAIIKATVKVESLLGTSLSPGAATEWFQPDSDLYTGVTPFDSLSLKTKHMFLTPTPPVVVTVVQGDPIVIAPADLVVDLEQGIVRVPKGYSGYKVKVSYQYGFGGDVEVPTPIKQAILVATGMVFRGSQVTTDAAVETTKPMTTGLLMEMLDRYMKRGSFLYKSYHFVPE